MDFQIGRLLGQILGSSRTIQTEARPVVLQGNAAGWGLRDRFARDERRSLYHIGTTPGSSVPGRQIAQGEQMSFGSIPDYHPDVFFPGVDPFLLWLTYRPEPDSYIVGAIVANEGTILHNGQVLPRMSSTPLARNDHLRISGYHVFIDPEPITVTCGGKTRKVRPGELLTIGHGRGNDLVVPELSAYYEVFGTISFMPDPYGGVGRVFLNGTSGEPITLLPNSVEELAPGVRLATGGWQTDSKPTEIQVRLPAWKVHHASIAEFWTPPATHPVESSTKRGETNARLVALSQEIARLVKMEGEADEDRTFPLHEAQAGHTRFSRTIAGLRREAYDLLSALVPGLDLASGKLPSHVKWADLRRLANEHGMLTAASSSPAFRAAHHALRLERTLHFDILGDVPPNVLVEVPLGTVSPTVGVRFDGALCKLFLLGISPDAALGLMEQLFKALLAPSDESKIINYLRRAEQCNLRYVGRSPAGDLIPVDTLIGVVEEFARLRARADFDPLVHEEELLEVTARVPEQFAVLRERLEVLGGLRDVPDDTDTPKIPGYHNLRKIGEGGMAIVYKAIREATAREARRWVALKVMLPQLTNNPEARGRFRREAEILRRLKHPNIVEYVDFHEGEDGHCFLVMEFLGGRTLEQSIKEEGPLRYDQAIGIVRQILEALHTTHTLKDGEGGSEKICHRDLKPSNVMLTTVGDNPQFVKVVDFGIAKMDGLLPDLTLEHRRRTGKNVIHITPHYAAPERLRGASGDARSDLFSVGAILYELLSGQKPFQGNFEELLRQYDGPTEAKPLVSDGKRWIPPSLVALVAKAIRIDPKERYQSAREFMEDLDEVAKSYLATTLEIVLSSRGTTSARPDAVAVRAALAALELVDTRHPLPEKKDERFAEEATVYMRERQLDPDQVVSDYEKEWGPAKEGDRLELRDILDLQRKQISRTMTAPALNNFNLSEIHDTYYEALPPETVAGFWELDKHLTPKKRGAYLPQSYVDMYVAILASKWLKENYPNGIAEDQKQRFREEMTERLHQMLSIKIYLKNLARDNRRQDQLASLDPDGRRDLCEKLIEVYQRVAEKTCAVLADLEGKTVTMALPETYLEWFILELNDIWESRPDRSVPPMASVQEGYADSIKRKLDAISGSLAHLATLGKNLQGEVRRKLVEAQLRHLFPQIIEAEHREFFDSVSRDLLRRMDRRNDKAKESVEVHSLAGGATWAEIKDSVLAVATSMKLSGGEINSRWIYPSEPRRHKVHQMVELMAAEEV